MDANIRQLQREAYFLWGIKAGEVVYDLPKFAIRSETNRFKFKMNFADKYQSWPRIYKLSIPYYEGGRFTRTKIHTRILMPIILFKEYDDLKFTSEAWYDMPQGVHEELIELIESELTRRLTPIQKFWNIFMPFEKVTKQIPVEDFVYEIRMDKDRKDFYIQLLGNCNIHNT